MGAKARYLVDGLGNMVFSHSLCAAVDLERH
jgi:hypothetical protein